MGIWIDLRPRRSHQDRAPGHRAGGDLDRHRRDIRIGEIRADRRGGDQRAARQSVPRDEAVSRRPPDAGGLESPRQRAPAGRGSHRPVPAALAESHVSAACHDASHEEAGGRRPAEPRRRQQLLARAVARGGEGIRRPTAVEPGEVQPARPGTGARPRALGAAEGPHRHRLQPAWAGSALWPLPGLAPKQLPPPADGVPRVLQGEA